MSIFTAVTIDIDPSGHYVGINRDRIRDSLGYIPEIVNRAVLSSENEDDVGHRIWEVYMYGEPMLPSETESKFNNGLLTYPGDEPQYPIAVYYLNNTKGLDIKFWQYERAMTVYTVNGEARLIGRMD